MVDPNRRLLEMPLSSVLFPSTHMIRNALTTLTMDSDIPFPSEACSVLTQVAVCYLVKLDAILLATKCDDQPQKVVPLTVFEIQGLGG